MLHSLEYLQATVQFAAHTQALTEKEHLLLDESAAPLEAQDSPLDRAADDVSAANISVIIHSSVCSAPSGCFRAQPTLHCFTLRAAHI